MLHALAAMAMLKLEMTLYVDIQLNVIMQSNLHIVCSTTLHWPLARLQATSQSALTQVMAAWHKLRNAQLSSIGFQSLQHMTQPMIWPPSLHLNDCRTGSVIQGSEEQQVCMLGCLAGSADLWVPSISCPNIACAYHNQYDPRNSSTSETSDFGALLVYGTGAAFGRTDSDKIQIGEPPIVIANQSFGEMFNVSNDFLTASCDGLFVRPILDLTSYDPSHLSLANCKGCMSVSTCYCTNGLQAWQMRHRCLTAHIL